MPTKFTLLLIVLCLLVSFGLTAQNGKYYTDHNGVRLFVPKGKISFADEAVYFNPGLPWKSKTRERNKSFVLNEPDVKENVAERNDLSLGCGGVLIVKFIDNVLIDSKGDDIFIFEVGERNEPVKIHISKDGDNWIYVGKTDGGSSAIDISGKVKKEDRFFFVKVTDLMSCCKSNNTCSVDDDSYDGADIDAIAAIGTISKEKYLQELKQKEIAKLNQLKKEKQQDYLNKRKIENSKTSSEKNSSISFEPQPQSEDNLLGKAERENILPIKIEEESTNFNLQSFNRNAELIIWDGQQEDNDAISIYINERKIIDNLQVKNKPVKFDVLLKKGENLFKIVSESCGETGKNSAAFRIKSKKIDHIKKMNIANNEIKEYTIVY